jgi:uncharacterized protein (DUF2236 family)
MRIPIPTPQALTDLLVRPLPFGRRPLPLHDSTPDPGLFGPDSVTWRVMHEPLLILGGGRALLMQAANPLVAQGAIDFSAYAEDPFGRLMRTIHWVTMVTYGTRAEAVAACNLVNRMHTRIVGALPAPHATRRMHARREYSALDGELLRWVHASFVDTMLVTHDALVGGLSEADRDTFVSEWDAVADLMHVPPRLLWSSHRELREYVDGEVARGVALPGAGSRLVSRTVLRPPLPSPWLRPGWDVVAFTTVGLVPAAVRRAYGVLWTPAHSAAHRALCLTLRRTHDVLPRRLQMSPVHELAMARVEGRWPQTAADAVA